MEEKRLYNLAHDALLMIFFSDQRSTFLEISLKRQRKKRQDTQRTKPRN